MTERRQSHDPDPPGRRSPRVTGAPEEEAAPADSGGEGGVSQEGGGEQGGGEATTAATPATGADEFRDRWLRAEAELQNFRRRATREWEEGRRNAEEAVLLEIVASLDDLERALEAARTAGAEAEWTQGVALVAQRMRDSLARQGVIVVDPAGEPFDPRFHDALLETDAPEGTAPGTVIQVVQKGYRRGERALRAARVVVGRTGNS